MERDRESRGSLGSERRPRGTEPARDSRRLPLEEWRRGRRKFSRAPQASTARGGERGQANISNSSAWVSGLTLLRLNRDGRGGGDCLAKMPPDVPHRLYYRLARHARARSEPSRRSVFENDRKRHRL